MSSAQGKVFLPGLINLHISTRENKKERGAIIAHLSPVDLPSAAHQSSCSSLDGSKSVGEKENVMLMKQSN